MPEIQSANSISSILIDTQANGPLDDAENIRLQKLEERLFDHPRMLCIISMHPLEDRLPMLCVVDATSPGRPNPFLSSIRFALIATRIGVLVPPTQLYIDWRCTTPDSPKCGNNRMRILYSLRFCSVIYAATCNERPHRTPVRYYEEHQRLKGDQLRFCYCRQR